MADKAVIMADEFRQLLAGKIPKTSVWKSEASLKHEMPASKNKIVSCNASEILWNKIKGNEAKVREWLNWFDWFVAQPFMEGECLTPEEVYRGLPLYAVYAAAAVAYNLQRFDTYAACIAYCKADVTYLLLSAGAGPGRKVKKWDTNGKDGTVLIGDGDRISRLPFVAQAGMRGLIRSGGVFLFVNAEALSVMLAQSFDLPIDKPARTLWNVECFRLIRAMAPGIPPFGFSSADQTVGNAFLKNPTDYLLARSIVGWLGKYIPPLDFEWVRYADGSILHWCWRGHASSTDEKPVAGWFADGRTLCLSSDDGNRKSSSGQIVTETKDRICSSFIDRGPLVCYPKPTAAEVWRVSIRDGKVKMISPGSGEGVSIDLLPPLPIPPVIAVGPKPPKKLPWWRRIFG